MALVPDASIKPPLMVMVDVLELVVPLIAWAFAPVTIIEPLSSVKVSGAIELPSNKIAGENNAPGLVRRTSPPFIVTVPPADSIIKEVPAPVPETRPPLSISKMLPALTRMVRLPLFVFSPRMVVGDAGFAPR